MPKDPIYNTKPTPLIKPALIPDKEQAAEDLPINRVRHLGPAALSNSELISLLMLGNPNSVYLGQNILRTIGDIQTLSQLSVAEIASIDGVNPGEAMRILAALELGRRLHLPQLHDKIILSSINEAAKYLCAEIGYKKREYLVTMQLSANNQILGISTIYQGSINTITLRLAEILKPAIVQDANSIILCHNHPDGFPQPSPADITTTHKFIGVCETMGIRLDDHIIVAKDKWISMEQEVGFNRKQE